MDLAGAAGESKWRRFFPVLVLAVSAVLLLAATRGDLAIDEVVSLNRALSAPSWGAIFTQDQNDNNHLLNTVCLRLLGEQRHLFIYRIPAAIFAIGVVAVLMATARRLGKTTTAWAACFAGLSYPVILYGSEARGYAPAMFFAVAAFELLQRCRERCTPAQLFLFWLALGLGILSHFSFLMVCFALGSWTLVRDRLAGFSIREILRNALKFFGLPVVFLAGVYLIYIRHMIILGGLVQTWRTVVPETISYALGFSDTGGIRFVPVILALGLAGSGLWLLFRQKRDEWIFFALMLLVAPALVLGLWQPKFLYFRYFSVCFPFFYLLLAALFDNWFRQAGKMKFIPVLLLLAITAGHLVKVAGLLQLGRGNYRPAVRDMAAATPGPLIRVGSDNDFKNRTLLAFYARFLPPGKSIEYIPQERRAQEKPDWIILYCLDTTFRAYPDVEVGHVGKYLLFGTYPYCGSSGWSWFVHYRPAETIPVQNGKSQNAP
jgi:hypothetical protein